MSISRIAIVTGCCGGIGRNIALQLADDGCDIVVNDLEHQIPYLSTLVEEISSKGRAAVMHVGDISMETNVKELVELAVSTFGGIDIVCISGSLMISFRNL
jgi:NAD(P)-dependent dehydrogenase (short-subunit alcohol dehydrogenase family)